MKNQTKETDWFGGYQRAALASSVLTAIIYAIDSFVVNNLIVYESNQTLAVLAYLVLGAWTLVIMQLIVNKLLGRKLDKRYIGLKTGSGRIRLLAVGAGGFAAISTFAYLFAFTRMDPSLVIPLSQVSILYVCLYDFRSRKHQIAEILLPMGLVLLGSCIASIESFGPFLVTTSGILLLLVFRSGTNALGSICEQRATTTFDAVSFTTWRFFWLAIFGTMLAISYGSYVGSLNVVFRLAKQAAFGFPMIVVCLNMLLAACAMTLAVKAKGLEEMLSKVLLLLSANIALGVPVTMFVILFIPDAFGEVPSGQSIWIVRFVGAVVVTIGVYFLTLLKERTKEAESRKETG